MRALKIWGMTMVVVIAVLGLYIYQNNREYQIILLNTNDSHGSILPVDSVGGMAERATFIRMVREKNPYVLLVDAGDINTGQAISNRADAKPDILAYNYMGYDAVTVGNHEFDKPLNVLLKQMQWAEFPFVTSNIQRNGTPLGVEYLIKEIGGVKIATGKPDYRSGSSRIYRVGTRFYHFLPIGTGSRRYRYFGRRTFTFFYRAAGAYP